MTEAERHYSTTEVATQFSVTSRTVATWIKDGKLIATKPGGKNWRVSQTEVTRFANQMYGDKSASADQH